MLTSIEILLNHAGYTSQMIHHCGVSLSKQHTYFVTAYKEHITADLSLHVCSYTSMMRQLTKYRVAAAANSVSMYHSVTGAI